MAPRSPLVAASMLAALALLPTHASAIVGGNAAAEGEYPWMAAITSGSGSSQYCGGSLVDSTTVVTAAHCMGSLLGIPLVDDLLSIVLSSPVYVLLGTNHLSSGGETIEATEIFVHPDYDGDHDVAVLKLASPSGQTPIALAQPGQEALWAAGVLAVSAGWGATSEGGSGSDELREVQLPVVSDAQCVAHYGSGSVDPATELCAGWPEGGRDTCQGDSGGPFMVPDGAGGLLLAGIVSWGDGCARPGVPGVYAEVAPLSGFIESHMGGSGSAAAASGDGPLAPLGLGARSDDPTGFADPAVVTGHVAGAATADGPIRKLVDSTNELLGGL